MLDSHDLREERLTGLKVLSHGSKAEHHGRRACWRKQAESSEQGKSGREEETRDHMQSPSQAP